MATCPPGSVVVADGVVDEVAESSLEEGLVALYDDGLGRDGVIQGEVSLASQASVARNDALDQRPEIDRRSDLGYGAGVEARAGVEVAEQRSEVIRLIHRAPQRIAASGWISRGRLSAHEFLQIREVTLKHGERQHHVVRGVCDIREERLGRGPSARRSDAGSPPDPHRSHGRER